MKISIRKFEAGDEYEVAEVIKKTLIEVNSKDYDKTYIEQNIAAHDYDVILNRAQNSHMYVVTDDNNIIGVGAIAPYWGSLTESILLTIFVLPEYHGQGIGKIIIKTLEKDEYFVRAERVEIPSSITARDFYIKMGYSYKNNDDVLDHEGCYRLEKHN